MEIRPITLKAANQYVEKNHRHNGATAGAKFCLGLYEQDGLEGVAICGNPVARGMDDGRTLEIRRVCTLGARNGCSMLYGACVRVARAMGYKRVITYTLQSESGASLRASNFMRAAETKERSAGWDTPSRPREIMQETLFGEKQKYPTEGKVRWEIKL